MAVYVNSGHHLKLNTQDCLAQELGCLKQNLVKSNKKTPAFPSGKAGVLAFQPILVSSFWLDDRSPALHADVVAASG